MVDVTKKVIFSIRSKTIASKFVEKHKKIQNNTILIE